MQLKDETYIALLVAGIVALLALFCALLFLASDHQRPGMIGGLVLGFVICTAAIRGRR